MDGIYIDCEEDGYGYEMEMGREMERELEREM
jgi:hypothetical protein